MKTLSLLTLAGVFILTGCAGQHMTGDAHPGQSCPVQQGFNTTADRDAGTPQQQQQVTTFQGRQAVN